MINQSNNRTYNFIAKLNAIAILYKIQWNDHWIAHTHLYGDIPKSLIFYVNMVIYR